MEPVETRHVASLQVPYIIQMNYSYINRIHLTNLGSTIKKKCGYLNWDSPDYWMDRIVSRFSPISVRPSKLFGQKIKESINRMNLGSTIKRNAVI